MKKIKIYAEVPEDWIEAQRADDLASFLRAGKEMIVNKAIQKIIDKVVENTKIPEIEIDKEKLTEYVMREMAIRKVDGE